MNRSYYPLKQSEDTMLFEFSSIGPNGIIHKIIKYQSITDRLYNLALGDKQADGSVDDLTVSNNNDMDTVISTVVVSLNLFFMKYPTLAVYFAGSTPSRTRLYQIIISRELEQAQEKFIIYGIINDQSEPFNRSHNYQAFIILLNEKSYENE